MNLDRALVTISGVLAESGKIGPVVGPGRWHVLFGGRQRPLLVPPGEYRLQKLWLSHFISGRLRSAWARAALRLNALLPGIRWLPGFEPPRALDAGPRAGAPLGMLAAIQIGTAGAHQKASALLVSDDGIGLALAKIALGPGADAMVATEANWLRVLARGRRLAGEVPQLLAEGTLAHGRRYLVTTLAPSTVITTDFTPAHARFLTRLGRSRMEIMRFGSSPCCEFLERALNEIAPGVTREEAAQLRDALRECRSSLDGHVGPFVFSQGDFAWWNIRVHPKGIFVFDWESANYGANPLADLFHFHMIQRAAAGRAIGRWFLGGVMRRAQRFACEHYPEARWRASNITAFALAYLLDVLFRYSRASGKIDHDEHVMQGYWDLLARRSTWMAA